MFHVLHLEYLLLGQQLKQNLEINSNLQSIAGALCVICPTEILLTPVYETFLTFLSVIPPEASVS